MSEQQRLLKSYLPMSEASFLLLASLCRPQHGYGIMQSVLELTAGRVSLGAGTVYTILYKMEGDGLIEVVAEEERRKVYAITQLGQKVLQAEAQRIFELADIAAKTQNTYIEIAPAAQPPQHTAR